MRTAKFRVLVPSGPERFKVLTVAKKREGQPLFLCVRQHRPDTWDLSAKTIAITREEAEAEIRRLREQDAEYTSIFGGESSNYALCALEEVTS